MANNDLVPFGPFLPLMPEQVGVVVAFEGMEGGSRQNPSHHSAQNDFGIPRRLGLHQPACDRHRKPPRFFQERVRKLWTSGSNRSESRPWTPTVIPRKHF